MLFAGTTEGRKLCEYLTGKNCDTYVYVTTEYGRELLPQADNVHIHTVILNGNKTSSTRK